MTRADPAARDRPTIVCLCGSSRFKDEFEHAAQRETLAGRIVLTLGIFSATFGIRLSPDQVKLQHRLHRSRIDLSDEILIVNPNGYVGESTSDEIAYARAHGKPVRWLYEQL